MRISDWSSDVCSSDLGRDAGADLLQLGLCLVPLRHQFGIARSGANLQARVHRRLEGMVVAGELARRDAQALQLVVLVGELLLQAQQILAEGLDLLADDDAGRLHGADLRRLEDSGSPNLRSERRRVGKGCVSPVRYW